MSDNDKAWPGVPDGVTQKREEIEIPENAIVGCPMHEAMVSVVGHCAAGCKYSAGLSERVIGDAPFQKKYCVVCQFPRNVDIFTLKA